MSYRQFGLGFLIATVVALAGTGIMFATLNISYATAVIIGMGIVLALVCVLMFWLGKRTASAENKFLFGNVFLGMTGVKMFLCAGVLVTYILLGEPKSSLFILPVFFLYLIYTVLEVVTLMRLSREAK